MPAAGVVMIIAVVAIIVAVVYYLMMTIVALIRIRNGLDEAISGVTGIIDKTAPLNEVVPTVNQNLDAGVDLLEGLLDVAGKVAGNTANIPQLQATAPVLGMIVEEAVVQDGYMNALTDGYGNGNGAK